MPFFPPSSKREAPTILYFRCMYSNPPKDRKGNYHQIRCYVLLLITCSIFGWDGYRRYPAKKRKNKMQTTNPNAVT